MAATREKRSTAGNRLSKMIAEEEDDDDFYKTTYGGFNEEVSDHDYNSNASDSDDLIDSDFDIDENDELRSDLEDDDGPKSKKRKVGVVTKSYQEPKRKTDEDKAKDKEKVKKRAEEKKKAMQFSVQIYHQSPKKSLRRSTAVKSEAAEIRKKARDERTQMMKEIAAKKNVPEVRRLTQEELLRESKITEKLNAKSLEDYRKLELERKKSRVSTKKYVGPVIRYHSVTMPLIDEIPSPEIEINVDGEFDYEKDTKTSIRSKDKCSRTFITFTDDKIYEETFQLKKLKTPIRQYCPVTRLPAKYFDPVTQTPYASAQAFRCIRDAYNQHIQLQLEKRKREMTS